jgi:hypothetical protein
MLAQKGNRPAPRRSFQKKASKIERLSFDPRLDIGVGCRRLFKIMLEHPVLHPATPATSGYHGHIHRE